MDKDPFLTASTPSNLPELSVGELGRAIRSTLEGAFGRVRVRGEISNFKRHGSGHLYFRLKDDEAVIEACCWRQSAARLAVRPEDGLEVICIGRVSAYAGRSQYQLIVESIELAGEGALLKLLEDRRRKLTAEGLFDPARKRPLPFLPDVIGIVTSPSGAVIRDIMHRLRERFPRRVLLWPVAVQGETAAAQITSAIRGFAAIPPSGQVPRPDVLIVARGGGSLEDLWAFNEESVVRAAADSPIPLISAIGHETDTTLIDFAADRRAPTPTAAAEIVVPVRADLLTRLLDTERQLMGCGRRAIDDRRARLLGLSRGLPDATHLLQSAFQRLDDRAERLANAAGNFVARQTGRTAEHGGRLRHPREQLAGKEAALHSGGRALEGAAMRFLAGSRHRFERLSAEEHLKRSTSHRLNERHSRLATTAALLESYSYKSVLTRGFVLVRHGDHVLSLRSQVQQGMPLTLTFKDGDAMAVGQIAPTSDPSALRVGSTAGAPVATLQAATGAAQDQRVARAAGTGGGRKPRGEKSKDPEQGSLL